MKIKQRIHNVATGETEDIERDMTAQELAQWQADKAAIAAEDKALAAAAAAKAALLEKLGITEDEAKLLLGGN
jgi:hypothetical protein